MKFLIFLYRMLACQMGSSEIPTAHVDMFSANVMHLSQQEESRLFPFVISEVQGAEKKAYDRIGKRTAQQKEGRHSRVQHTDTPHSRRWVTMTDYYDADLVDNEDKLRTIMEPENEYAMAIAASLGRQIDQVIIDQALGTAITGRDGTGSATLADANKVVAHDGSTTDGVGLNVRTLRAVKKKFLANEAIKKGRSMLIFVLAAQQLDDLLGNTEVTSSDFNVVKALVQGDVDTFMGFKFIHTELLPFTSAAVTYNIETGVHGSGTGTLASGEGRRCIAFVANKALRVGHGDLVKGRISEMPEFHYAKQVYGSLQIGCVRMEEAQVVEVICKEV